jgi:hypothetical protein
MSATQRPEMTLRDQLSSHGVLLVSASLQPSDVSYRAFNFHDPEFHLTSLP